MNQSASAPVIRVGISSCLLGQEVRFDGGHKRDAFINRVLSEHFEFVPYCPEVAIGLGVPRDPIRLERRDGDIRVVGVRQPGLDVTQPLGDYGREVARADPGISGYILKSKSPTCGMERVKVYDAASGIPAADGVGEFARSLMEQWPELPVEEEGRLNDPVLRENFIERVFTYRRWQELVGTGETAAGIVEFHTRHKLLIMSHSQKAYRELGRMVADCGTGESRAFGARYISALMAALRIRATRKNHANVLQHVQGYLKDHIDGEDKQELNEVIETYRLGRVPLVVPITLLNHHFRRHPDEYMQRQYYLNPHPPELMLRNLI
ncbi:MAG: DUF523 and DUF1722 domain-containing protein [Gammaproteobacteria bacterium]|nr:DUF523 and DUF1722 domain-containing protein [Gammaproteobacteria bacterium]